ncbi:MAG: AAA family ATPase, partial [Thiobacillus sp.]|nr:AAA family ATPase [Thiobacillus sp.]
MLLRFSVRNYRSLATEQEILFTESGLTDDARGLISVAGLSQRVLPVIAMYGPNASGKSNLLKAIGFVVSGVQDSYKKQPGRAINRRPFRLSKHDESDSTSMELDFIVKNFSIGAQTLNVRFTYGFKITDDYVEEEWLYAFPSGHRQVWFHRNRNESPEYYFGRALKGQNRVISGLTKPDALFISMAQMNNH